MFIEGFLLSTDPTRKAKEMAFLLAKMASDEQAVFFNVFADEVDSWGANPGVQWLDMKEQLSQRAISVLNNLNEHLQFEATNDSK